MSTLKTGKVKTTTIADELDTESTAVTNVINGTAKAWVTFNGAGVPAIRASFNVGSITDNGTGDYTVNLINPMPDINFSTTGACQRGLNQADVVFNIYANDNGTLVNPTTTTARMTMSSLSNVSVDSAFVCVAIFR